MRGHGAAYSILSIYTAVSVTKYSSGSSSNDDDDDGVHVVLPLAYSKASHYYYYRDIQVEQIFANVYKTELCRVPSRLW